MGGKTIKKGRTCLTQKSGWCYLQKEGRSCDWQAFLGVLSNVVSSDLDEGLLYKSSSRSTYVLCMLP